MIQTIEHATLVEMLLNSLEGERYVRRPLLLDLVDELEQLGRHSVAALARGMVRTLDQLTEPEFASRIDELKAAVRAATAA